MSSLYRIQACGARTTFPNTPESDKLPMVYHTVEYTIDHGETQTAYIMAKEPGDALRRANFMSIDEITKLNVKPVLDRDDNVDADGKIKRGHYAGLRWVSEEVGYVDEDEEYY